MLILTRLSFLVLLRTGFPLLIAITTNARELAYGVTKLRLPEDLGFRPAVMINVPVVRSSTHEGAATARHHQICSRGFIEHGGESEREQRLCEQPGLISAGSLPGGYYARGEKGARHVDPRGDGSKMQICTYRVFTAGDGHWIVTVVDAGRYPLSTF